MRELTLEQFEARFIPLKNHLVKDAPYCGWMFETYGPELAHVKTTDPNRVWTFMDDGDGGTCVVNGWHFVNRIGYIITRNPFPLSAQYMVDHEPGLEEEARA